MTEADKVKLVDDLIKQNPEATIKDFLEEVESIDFEVKNIGNAQINKYSNIRVTLDK